MTLEKENSYCEYCERKFLDLDFHRFLVHRKIWENNQGYL